MNSTLDGNEIELLGGSRVSPFHCLLQIFKGFCDPESSIQEEYQEKVHNSIIGNDDFQEHDTIECENSGVDIIDNNADDPTSSISKEGDAPVSHIHDFSEDNEKMMIVEAETGIGCKLAKGNKGIKPIESVERSYEDKHGYISFEFQNSIDERKSGKNENTDDSTLPMSEGDEIVSLVQDFIGGQKKRKLFPIGRSIQIISKDGADEEGGWAVDDSDPLIGIWLHFERETNGWEHHEMAGTDNAILRNHEDRYHTYGYREI